MFCGAAAMSCIRIIFFFFRHPFNLIQVSFDIKGLRSNRISPNQVQRQSSLNQLKLGQQHFQHSINACIIQINLYPCPSHSMQNKGSIAFRLNLYPCPSHSMQENLDQMTREVYRHTVTHTCSSFFIIETKIQITTCNLCSHTIHGCGCGHHQL
jgi:hypothetical protein